MTGTKTGAAAGEWHTYISTAATCGEHGPLRGCGLALEFVYRGEDHFRLRNSETGCDRRAVEASVSVPSKS
ncbi:hypothetical protein E2C01_002483 [Portunus trituberculatus]|uniref:Uncharacterized protein n=1 Tax=Portunus trituberculatus TaxID=210409 RepID=A0A5B7CKP3_PORTR|nr:hypothetical protein [Portunus trituberculatus]